MDGLISRVEIAEDGIGEFKDRLLEFTQSKQSHHVTQQFNS